MKYYSTEADLSFVLTDKSDISIKEHTHVSKYIVGLVLSGSIHITKGKERFICNKDDLFIIPIYVSHSIHILEQDTRFLSMCVGTSYIHTLMNRGENSRLSYYINKLVERNIISSENVFAFINAMDIVTKLYSDFANTKETEIMTIGKFIIDNPGVNVCVESLSDQVFLSKYYFLRKFKKEIGLPPHSFYIQNRIRKAQILLEENRNIANVSL